MTKYTFICTCCDGNDIIMDWPTRWNTTKQSWVMIENVTEAQGLDAWCNDCGDYFQMKRVDWHPVLPEEVS